MSADFPNIVVDLEKSRNPCSGLGQYAIHLGQHLAHESQRRGIRFTALVPKGSQATFACDETILARFWRKECFQRWYRWGSLLSQQSPQIWHATHQQVRFLPLNPRTPVILTIHDLNYLREKNEHRIAQEHRRLRKLIQRASVITVISKFVASEVQYYFDLQDKPIHVIYNGRPEQSIAPQKPDWISTDKPFLFTIGIIDRKKNFHVLLDLIRQLPNHQLVIAGNNKGAYAQEICQKAEAMGLSDRLKVPGPISDEHRQWLYENCEAFAFPSLTEGFGLPPIEAMNVGKPVFLARRTSLPEIGGNLAFYWDGFDNEHLLEVYQEGMQTYRSTPGYADQLRHAASRFSWKKAAIQYVDLYEQVAGGSSNRQILRAA